MGPGMHKHVEMLIGRLATDPGLRARFAKQPFEALRAERLELTAVEIEALASLDPAAIRAFAAALDARLRKAACPADSRPEGAITTTTTGPSQGPGKETSR
jgi:hypothetical protein